MPREITGLTENNIVTDSTGMTWNTSVTYLLIRYMDKNGIREEIQKQCREHSKQWGEDVESRRDAIVALDAALWTRMTQELERLRDEIDSIDAAGEEPDDDDYVMVYLITESWEQIDMLQLATFMFTQ